MTRKKKLLIAIVTLPFILIAVALLYLNFADLSGWRDTVERLASNAIGRELRINGEFQPEIGFTTHVVATDITLANPDWSDEPQMVTVDRLAGEIDLLSILFGPIAIGDVEITGARVLFEVDTDGRFNWALGSGEFSNGGGGDVELVIGHALVNNLQLVYARPEDRALEAEFSNLEFTDDGTGMLDLDLGGSVGGEPVEISGRLGTFIGLINASVVENDLSGRIGDIEFRTTGRIEDLAHLGGADLTARVHGQDLKAVAELLHMPNLPGVEFRADLTVKPATTGSDLALEASVGEITTHITGTVDSLTNPTALDVTVDASGPDVGTIGALAGIDELPAKPFSVTGRVQWAGFPLNCDKIEVRVGDNTLSAHGVLGEPPLMMETDFRFSGGGPDISAVAALAGLRVPKESYSVGGRLVRMEEALGVDEVALEVGGVTIEVDGTVGDPPEYNGTALTFHGEGPNLARLQSLVGIALPSEPFEVDGRLAQGSGAINLEGVRGHLGRTTVQVDGQLSMGPGFTGTDLRLKVDGPDASQVSAFAGLPTVPAEEFSVNGRVRVLANGYRVHDLVGSLGSLDLKADGFVALPPNLLGTDLQIHIEDSDLSHPASIAGITDLPHDSITVDARVRVEESGYRVTGLEATIGEVSAEVDGFVGQPPELEGTDLRIEAQGSRVAALGPYLQQPDLPGAPFSVAGGLRIEKASLVLDQVVAEVADNRVEVDGSVTPNRNLVGTDVSFDFRGSDLGDIEALAAGFIELPELPKEPYSLTGSIAIDGSGFDLRDVQLQVADSIARAAGRVGAPPGFLGSDLKFDIDGPSAILFSSLTGVATPVAPLEAAGRIERDEAGFRFHDVTARLGEYQAAVDGILGELPKLIGTELEIHASGPDTNFIEELSGLADLPNQPFKLDGEFSGTPERFSTRDFDLVFGSSDLEGSFTVDLTEKPMVTARLTSNVIDLSRLRDRLEDAEITGDEVLDPEPPAADPGTILIPDEPIDLTWLDTVDGDVAVRIKKLILRAKQFHDLKVDVHLEEGRFEIERVTAVGQDQGRLTGSLSLEPVADEYRLETDITFHQIRLDIQGSEVDRMEQPPIDIEIDLEATGASPHELASSADGAVQLVIGKGVMDSGVLELVTADILLTLLNAFNPFAKQDAATELQCGVALLSFDNGVANLEPMAFQSDKMTLLGHGKIDLRTERLSLEWITKPRKGIGISASMITNPYIRLGGTLSAPSVQLKEAEAVVSTGAAVATLGLSLVAKGMYDRITAEKKVCKNALEEIESRTPGTSDKPTRRK